MMRKFSKGYILVETMLILTISSILMLATLVSITQLTKLSHLHNTRLISGELFYTTTHLKQTALQAGYTKQATQAYSPLNFSAMQANSEVIIALQTQPKDSQQRDCLNQLAGSNSSIITEYSYSKNILNGTIICHTSIASNSDHIADHIKSWLMQALATKSMAKQQIMHLNDTNLVNMHITALQSKITLNNDQQITTTLQVASGLARSVTFPVP